MGVLPKDFQMMGCTESKKERRTELEKDSLQNSTHDSMIGTNGSEDDTSAHSLLYTLLEREKVVKTKGGNSLGRLIANGKYRIIGTKISSGAFGEVFPAVEVGNEKHLLAIKTEALDSDDPQLEHEYRMYKRFKNTEGIPDGYWFGQDNEGKHYMLVMDMLGPSLKYLLKKVGDKFSVKTVLLLADKLIPILKIFHDSDFIHRDLKPANLVIGHRDGPDKNKIFLIDFGLSKRYRNSITQEVRPMEIRYKGLIGTYIYASVAADDGIQQAPKDDMESLGYIFFYLLGELPWMHCPESTTADEFIEMISHKKRNMLPEEYSKVVPIEFATFLNTMKNLKYEDRPPYEKMKSLFRNLAKKLNIQYDNLYDWNLKKNKANKF